MSRRAASPSNEESEPDVVIAIDLADSTPYSNDKTETRSHAQSPRSTATQQQEQDVKAIRQSDHADRKARDQGADHSVLLSFDKAAAAAFPTGKTTTFDKIHTFFSRELRVNRGYNVKALIVTAEEAGVAQLCRYFYGPNSAKSDSSTQVCFPRTFSADEFNRIDVFPLASFVWVPPVEPRRPLSEKELAHTNGCSFCQSAATFVVRHEKRLPPGRNYVMTQSINFLLFIDCKKSQIDDKEIANKWANVPTLEVFRAK